MKRNVKHLLILLISGLLFSSAAIAQTTLSGNVTDDLGVGLFGANVVVKGTTDGAVTDENGNYSVTTSAELPLTLVFSYTGFTTQEIEVSSDAPINVSLVEGGLLMDEVIISASRRREKVQEAPASVAVISAKKLATSPQATDPTRNLIGTAGVTIQQQSANRINIAMRGSSGLFGTSVFPILDYRSLVGPGIGTFQSDQAGLSTIDLQRIEVVRGPGSALYGPGVTQGVVHFISKSAIDYPGTTLELMGGQLETFGASIRHATKVSDKFGYKINATYRLGKEFTLDPNDPDDAAQIAKFQKQIVQPGITNGVVDSSAPETVLLTESQLDRDGDGNPMSDSWDNQSINATFEFRPKDNLSIVASGGYNSARSVFYNEQGEGFSDAREYWGQARVQAGGLFAQVFAVDNDGGTEENPSFLYQTGNRAPVARTQLEAQLQYNFDTPSLLNANWTAGVDYRFAGQDTENLVYGRNEDDDDFSIIGGYVQGKLKLHDKMDLVLAGRYDQFNFIDEGAFAPRAALVYKPAPNHTVRASFNRANSTVSNLQLNIDFPLSTVIPGAFDVWLYGNKTEQTFNNPEVAWFTPAIPNVPIGTDGLPLGVAYAAVAAPTNAGILAFLNSDPNLAPLAPIVQGVLGGIDPNTLGTTGSLSGGFNVFDGTPLGLTNAPISRISTLDVIEVGYKGLIGEKLGVTLDVYYNITNNASQFTAISPAYILSGVDALPGDLGGAIATQFGPNLVAALVGAGQPQAVAEAIAAQITPAVAGAYGQAGDAFLNTPNAAFGGASFSQVLAALPFHATTPTDQVPADGVNHLAAGYRTFTQRDQLGLDLGFEYYFSNDFSSFLNYSWIRDTEFLQNVVGFEDQPALPTFANIPQHKIRAGVNYAPEMGIRGSLTYQYDDTYFASAGQFSGNTDVRNLIDASIGYRFNNGLAFDLAVTNALNNEYRFYPNMPKIGRRAILKMVYNFAPKKKN